MSTRTANPQGTALERLYAVLCEAAKQGAPCPSNRALCARAGIEREGAVTTLLGHLRARALIAVDWTAPVNGARRVVIRATGEATGWSLHGPRWGGGMRIPRDGAAAFARLLRAREVPFQNVSTREARRIRRDSPADIGLPPRPEPSSWMGCALAGLRGEPEPEIARRLAAAANT